MRNILLLQKLLSLLALSLILGACASGDGTINSQAEYEQATPRNTSDLTVPPGLIAPTVNDTYSMLHGVSSGGGYKLDKIEDMSIVASGSERWLVAKNTTVDKVFPMMLSYIRQQGMTIKYQNKSIGLIQTAWFNKNAVESRGASRQFFDWIGMKSGVAALPSLYTFRVNLWQNESTTTIFVTDYQMDMRAGECDVATSSKDIPLANPAGLATSKDANWVSVPSDPQLELDFLLQFIAYAKSGADVSLEKPMSGNLGMVAAGTTAVASEDKLVGNKLELYNTFDRAWWRTGLALERVGLGVTDRNRSAGEFYTYPLQAEVANDDPGSFSRWFGDDKSTLQLPKAKYTIKLVSNGTVTTLTLEPYAGTAVDKDFAKKQAKYLAELANQLK